MPIENTQDLYSSESLGLTDSARDASQAGHLIDHDDTRLPSSLLGSAGISRHNDQGQTDDERINLCELVGSQMENDLNAGLPTSQDLIAVCSGQFIQQSLEEPDHQSDKIDAFSRASTFNLNNQSSPDLSYADDDGIKSANLTRPPSASLETDNHPPASPIISANEYKQQQKLLNSDLFQSESEDEPIDESEGEDDAEGQQEEDEINSSDDEMAMFRKMVAANKKKQRKGFTNEYGKLRKEFVEHEAELSGSDFELDENDEMGSDQDHYEHEEGDEDQLPSDSEIKEQLERLYRKDMLDEDKRKLMKFREALIEDKLASTRRIRRFRWREDEDDPSEWWKTLNLESLIDGTDVEGEHIGDATTAAGGDETVEMNAREREAWLRDGGGKEVIPGDEPQTDMADNDLLSVRSSKDITVNRAATGDLQERNGGHMNAKTWDELMGNHFAEDFVDDAPLLIKKKHHRESILGRGDNALANIAKSASVDDSSGTASMNFSKCVYTAKHSARFSSDSAPSLGSSKNNDSSSRLAARENSNIGNTGSNPSAKRNSSLPIPTCPVMLKKPKLTNENSGSLLELI